MADTQHPPVSPIARKYLDAREAILSDQPNANHAFILASQGLMERNGKLPRLPSLVREVGLYIPPLPFPPNLASKEVTAVYDRVPAACRPSAITG